MESQPQNPEFRINPENFHQCRVWLVCIKAIIICLIQHFEADFLWKVSLKIQNPENFHPCRVGLVCPRRSVGGA